MNYQRILISEAEKKRILGAHKSYAKRNNLNFGRLNEQAALEYTTKGEVKYEGFGYSNGNSYKAIDITIPKESKVTSYPAGNGYGAGVQVKGKETKINRGDVTITLVCGTGYFSYSDKPSGNQYQLKQVGGDGNFASEMQSHFCDGKNLKTNKTEENQNKNTNTNWTQPPSLQNVLAGTSVIKTGMMGDSVGKIQEILKNGKDANGPLYDGNIDNKYGSKTKDAVIKFQKIAFPDNPEEWDGIVGKNTLTLLNKEGKDNNIDLGLSQSSGENTQTKQVTTPESTNQQQINQSVEQEDITISFIEPTF